MHILIASIHAKVLQVAPFPCVRLQYALHFNTIFTNSLAVGQCSSPHPSQYSNPIRSEHRVSLMSPSVSSVSGLAALCSNNQHSQSRVTYRTWITSVLLLWLPSVSLPSASPPFHQFHLSSSSHHYQTSIQSVPVSLHSAVKRPERAAGHVPQSSADVKNKWNSASTSLRVFKAWKGTIVLTVVPLWYSLCGLQCCLSEMWYRSASLALEVGRQTDRNWPKLTATGRYSDWNKRWWIDEWHANLFCRPGNRAYHFPGAKERWW